MHYKTIILGLLQDRPQMYDQLLRNRTLLQVLEGHAQELRAIHEAWKDHLWQAKPSSAASQIANEALELALEEWERRLPPASPTDETEPLSLNAAMAFIRPHTPPA